MKALLVFDGTLNKEDLKQRLIALKPESISIFPLTSDWRLIDRVRGLIRQILNCEAVLIASAQAIDGEMESLGSKISAWSYALGEYKVKGKSIREWLFMPDKTVSTWFFTLVSEKNPLKTDTFFSIAQLEAVEKQLKSGGFDGCIYSLENEGLQTALETLCKRYRIESMCLSGKGKKKSLFLIWLSALYYVRIVLRRSVTARRIMRPVENRIPKEAGYEIFVSHFPFVDKELAKEGKLKNNYVWHLQKKMDQMKKKVIWIWMYSFMGGYTFRDALSLASSFARTEEVSFFIEEFLSPKSMLKCVFLWFRQILLYLSIRRAIPKEAYYKNFSIPEASILVQRLMDNSIIGRPVLDGILYLEAYKNLFSSLQNARHCLYLFEMQVWEKALNAAKNIKAPQIKTMAFQHTYVSRKHFFYFPHSYELMKNSKTYLPMPDMVVSSGDIPAQRLVQSGYENVKKVEGIRHLHLIPYLSNAYKPQKEDILLIAGTISKAETQGFISMCDYAVTGCNCVIWFKGHPALPNEELEIPAHFIIKDEPIDELMRRARISVCGSSPAFEALSMGCEVILPVLPDAIFLNPLDGLDGFAKKVYTPEELRASVLDKSLKPTRKEVVELIPRYWRLDDSLRKWEEVLSA